MSRDDWPEMSYTAAMMADHAPRRRKVIGYRSCENVSIEECARRKQAVRLNARQQALLAHLESKRELPAPRYANGYIGQKQAEERLERLGVWRVTWLSVLLEGDSLLEGDLPPHPLEQKVQDDL